MQMSSKFEFLHLIEFSLIMIESIELIFHGIGVFLPKYLQKVAGTLYDLAYEKSVSNRSSGLYCLQGL